MTEPGTVDVFIEIRAGFYARVGFRYVRLRCKEGLFRMEAPAGATGLHWSRLMSSAVRPFSSGTHNLL